MLSSTAADGPARDHNKRQKEDQSTFLASLWAQLHQEQILLNVGTPCPLQVRKQENMARQGHRTGQRSSQLYDYYG